MKRLIISPHPDDAALSCSGILSSESKVIVPFSQSSYSISQYGTCVTALRQKEDIKAMSIAGASLVHGELPDSSKRNTEAFCFFGTEGRLFKALEVFIKKNLKGPYTELWLPAGIGGHIEHIATNRIGLHIAESLSIKVIIYADQYYLSSQSSYTLDPADKYLLKPHSSKSSMLQAYKSQLDSSTINRVLSWPEYYWKSE